MSERVVNQSEWLLSAVPEGRGHAGDQHGQDDEDRGLAVRLAVRAAAGRSALPGHATGGARPDEGGVDRDTRARALQRHLRSRNLTPLEAEVMAAILETESEEGHGYRLSRACDAPTGSMYRALKNLADLGYVQSRAEDSRQAEAGRRRPRRLYTVTPAGEEALAEWRTGQILRSPSARLIY